MIALALLMQVVTAPPAVVSTANLATKAEVAAVAALVPVPAATTPPSEMIGGSVGTAGTYRPADSATPRITRATTVTTDTAGAWSVTWGTPLNSAPVVIPVPVNASTQPIVCNVTARTMTAASGRCWLARSLPATLSLVSALVSYDVFGAAASNVSVQIIALPPTQ